MATVLVVDHESALLQLVTTILEDSGYRVVTASSGLEALLLYESYTRHIDMVLTDVDMPEMTGPELAARIHSNHPSARILLMGGSFPSGLANLPESYPLTLTKPFSPEELLSVVRTACGK